MAIFDNNTVNLQIDRKSGSYSLHSPIHLAACEMWVSGQDAVGQPFTFPIHLDAQEYSLSHLINSGQQMVFSGLDQDSGLGWTAEFWVPDNGRMITWWLTVSNRGNSPCYINQIGLLRPADEKAGNLTMQNSTAWEDISVFCNGWQSWSYSAAFSAGQRMRRSRLGLLQESMVLNPDTPLPRRAGAFGSDFFTVLGDTRRRTGLLLGFLSQKMHFGSLGVDLRRTPAIRMWANGDEARLDAGESISTDTAVAMPLDIDQPDALGGYLEAVAREHGIGALPNAPTGWCSWYEYYQNISEGIILGNLARMDELRSYLPLELLQIDDGYQAQVGDWLRFGPGFPNGVADLAQEIKERGFTPGLWLAPFILHPSSRTARAHPDWLLRDAKDRLVQAGFGWNALAVALDLTVPQALDYAGGVVGKAAGEWGYPYLKLDFLYAAALKGRYRDPTRTRAQVLRAGMQALREAAGEDTFLLGCGAPLGSVLGLVDGMRIGADVSARWKPSYHGIGLPFKHEPHMPSVRNAMQNILTRAGLHERWWVNDPDCLLVRADTHLNQAEVQSLATAIALTGGALLISDDLSKLTPERLRLAACLLPPINRRARVLDWMDAETPEKLRLDQENTSGQWTLIAGFNWDDRERECEFSAADIDLPAGQDVFVRSFWGEKVWLARAGEPIFSGRLPAHGTVLLALRTAGSDSPLFLGSDLHISQGLEVDEWNHQQNELQFALALGRTAEGYIDLYLPNGLKRAELNGKPTAFGVLGEGCWRITVQVEGRARLRLVSEKSQGVKS